LTEYKAKHGRPDRDGEMTGAISINLMLTALPVTIWAVFLGPLVFDHVGWVVATSVALGVALAFAGFPISRAIWARLSAWMDRSNF